MGDTDGPLAALRWHWGEAYIITTPGRGLWIAVRRDTHGMLTADDPEKLRALILADYCERQVPRPPLPPL